MSRLLERWDDRNQRWAGRITEKDTEERDLFGSFEGSDGRAYRLVIAPRGVWLNPVLAGDWPDLLIWPVIGASSLLARVLTPGWKVGVLRKRGRKWPREDDLVLKRVVHDRVEAMAVGREIRSDLKVDARQVLGA